jgi:hypothetical protein
MWKWGEGCIGRGLPVGLDQLVWKGAGEDGTIGLEVCIEAREGGLLQHHPPLGHLLLQQAGGGGGTLTADSYTKIQCSRSGPDLLGFVILKLPGYVTYCDQCCGSIPVLDPDPISQHRTDRIQLLFSKIFKSIS